MDNINCKTTEIKLQNGGKKRNVTIKRGKGSKSVTKYHKGKKNVLQIKMGKIIPGLFSDFSKKIIRNKKGGAGNITKEQLKLKMNELLQENDKIIEVLRNRQTILNAAMTKLNNMSTTDDTYVLILELITNLETQISEFNAVNAYYEEQFETLRKQYTDLIN